MDRRWLRSLLLGKLSWWRLVRSLFFPFDKFANIKKISAVHCPVLFIHGTHDRTIPFWHGQALFE